MWRSWAAVALRSSNQLLYWMTTHRSALSRVLFCLIHAFSLSWLCFYSRWTIELMNGTVSSWLVRRNQRNTDLLDHKRVFFNSHSQTLKGLPLKPPSQWSAWGSIWNRAAWWWEVCESYLVPRHKFSSDFTSPYCLPSCFTLRWPLGGQRVSISCQILQTQNSEDFPAVSRFTCLDALANYVCESMFDCVEPWFYPPWQQKYGKISQA